MGVVTEDLVINGDKFVKNYSDKGLFIERDGVQYEEAVDPIEYKDTRIYTETDIPIIDKSIEEGDE